MPPVVAIAAFAAFIAGLFYLDRDRGVDADGRTSPALWLAIIWIAIGASRMLSQWFSGISTGPTNEVDYLEGSAIDRVFLSAMLAASLAVLAARSKRLGPLLKANGPLIVFFLYCAVSVLWSDYPFVAFKRWTKALGNIAVVLLVLTDPYPYAAFKRVLARTGFLLVPLSVLYLKYFPALGRVYNRWTWTSTNIGVSTDKNGLGALCLVFGLASVWRLLEAGRDGEDRNRHALLAHGAMLVMATWLLLKADSSTSLACLVLGSIVLVLMRRPGSVRPLTANLIVSACAAAGVIALMFQNLYAYAVEGLGRNTTLTGRTDIWDDLFRMADRPLLGTGFESFWLGPRAEYLWNKYYFHPNQAHNGYIETYLNLGWAGVALLVIVIIWGYRNILASDRGSAGSLCFALFLVALIYNLTEAAFKVMHPLWIAFLFAAAAWPALEERASA